MRLLCCLLPVAVLLPACHDDETECPADPPAITSFSVTPTSVAAGADITATVVASNFGLGGEEHTEALPQHEEDAGAECASGHVHVYLDDLMTEPLVQTEASSFTLTIPDGTTMGDHTLIARLQNHDHTIIKPEVTAEATITVE